MNLATVLALKLLNAYLTIRYRRSFQEVKIDVSAVEGKIDLDQPVLFIGNHSSWWDGFFVYEVHKKLKLKKDFRIVMLESELKKFPFFRLCGAVGLIPKNSQHTEKIFSELKNHCVCFFPQGQLMPQNQRPLNFKPGLEQLIKKLHPVQIIAVGMHIEPFEFMKPTALIRAEFLGTSGEINSDATALAEATEKNLNQVSRQWATEIFLSRVKEWK